MTTRGHHGLMMAAGGSAAPTVAARNQSTEAFSSSHVATLPAGVVEGQLLLVWCATGGTVTHSVGSGVGWTKIADFPTGGGNPLRLSLFAKIATGSDALTVAFSGSAWGRTWSASLNGVSATTGISTSAATTTSSTPATPTLSTTNAARVWISTLAWVGTQGVTAYPSDYPDGRRNAVGAASNRVGFGCAERTLEAASVTPGAYTLSGSAGITANMTVGIAAA